MIWKKRKKKNIGLDKSDPELAEQAGHKMDQWDQQEYHEDFLTEKGE